MKVFVSYSHAQGDWVHDRLVPCLKAGGAEVLIDVERFRAGGGVYRQMDATQDQADRHVLVLSAEYLASKPCQHEMQRAIDLDPAFAHHIVQPVRRDDAKLPNAITAPDPIYVDLRDDSEPAPWDLLLRECGSTLGATAPDWLAARDEVIRCLASNRSVNLVIVNNPKWRELVQDVVNRAELGLAVVNLHDPATVPRSGLVKVILRALGCTAPVPSDPQDLPAFGQAIDSLGLARVALLEFDMVPHRRGYNVNLFATLRYCMMDKKQLVLLIQSRAPFSTLLPANNPLSTIDLSTVELRGRI
nr:toll/interleukin-1 receptor domain-containing protein [uncultured Rhodopila sp.]